MICQRVRCGSPVTVIHACRATTARCWTQSCLFLMQVVRRAKTMPRLKHTAKPLGIFSPSIIAEMLTTAVCTQADRKNVRRWSQFVCDLGFLETEVDGKKVCGIIHECGDVGCGCAGRAWIWSMVTGACVSLGTSRSRKVTIQFARQNPGGTFPLKIQRLRYHELS